MEISIHALLAESDVGAISQLQCILDFYPRSPCGERPSKTLQNWQKPHISIHALLAESDRGWTLNINGPMKFLSTLSLR